MKITLEIPDSTICAFFDFIWDDNGILTMQAHKIQTKDLYNGAEIKIAEIPVKEKKHDQN